jgi:hypothetical protein
MSSCSLLALSIKCAFCSAEDKTGENNLPFSVWTKVRHEKELSDNER